LIEEGDLRLRRAEPADVDFLAALLAHEEVEPFLAPFRATNREALLSQVERSGREPEAYGLFVLEVGGLRAGTMEFERSSARSRIARLGGLAVHPDFRGQGVGHRAALLFQRHLLVDLRFHRLELEVYGFNERALAHAERAGFVREGVKRRAYWRHGQWVDGVLFGLLREELSGDATRATAEPAASDLR
jgi:RimJ/RimL family protein N-acetyltransferase